MFKMNITEKEKIIERIVDIMYKLNEMLYILKAENSSGKLIKLDFTEK